jgi:hypothetical protein
MVTGRPPFSSAPITSASEVNTLFTWDFVRAAFSATSPTICDLVSPFGALALLPLAAELGRDFDDITVYYTEKYKYFSLNFSGLIWNYRWR